MAYNYYEEENWDIIDEDDFEDDDSISLEELDDECEGKFEVWFIGYDANSHITDFSYCYGKYNTKVEAFNAIDDFMREDHYSFREDFLVPDYVATIDIIGEAHEDEYLDTEIFYTAPVMEV